jgi:hypothetical protein
LDRARYGHRLSLGRPIPLLPCSERWKERFESWSARKRTHTSPQTVVCILGAWSGYAWITWCRVFRQPGPLYIPGIYSHILQKLEKWFALNIPMAAER